MKMTIVNFVKSLNEVAKRNPDAEVVIVYNNKKYIPFLPSISLYPDKNYLKYYKEVVKIIPYEETNDYYEY